MKQADILIGIPSYNNAQTIGHVVRACECGLNRYFPGRRAVILNSDGGSTDGTPDVFMSTEADTENTLFSDSLVSDIERTSVQYKGIPGKGSAFRTIFQAASSLDVDVCVVVDSDLRSINPLWVESLAGPIVYKNFDYVTPLYSRHKYDGTITNSIAYPLTAALYGKKVRQPIGGDFGVSRDLIEVFLKDESVWQTDVARFGIDIWMTTTAICEGFKICQSLLGAKIHDPKDPASSLGPMFKQVVTTIFSLADQYKEKWQQIDALEPVPIFGFYSETIPEPVNVNVQNAMERFRQGFSSYKEFWVKFLPKEIFSHLRKIAENPKNDLNFTPDLWAQIVFSFAKAYREKTCNGALVSSLTPLYLGYTAAFVKKTRKMDTGQAEEVIDDLCDTFLKFKKFF